MTGSDGRCGESVLELIDRARNGDREAFGTLAALSIDRLYAIAVRVVRDRDRAEDAVQSALLVMDTRDMRFDSTETLRRYPSIDRTSLEAMVTRDYLQAWRQPRPHGRGR